MITNKLCFVISVISQMSDINVRVAEMIYDTFNPFIRSHFSDRSGIENVKSVEMLQDSLIKALRTLVSKSAPGDVSRFTKLLLKLPDLRTLNNMHSEKLLSFRIDA